MSVRFPFLSTEGKSPAGRGVDNHIALAEVSKQHGPCFQTGSRWCVTNNVDLCIACDEQPPCCSKLGIGNPSNAGHRTQVVPPFYVDLTLRAR